MTRACLLLLLLPLAACGGSDQPARTDSQQVCRDVAEYARDGQREADRPGLVASIGERIGGADPQLREAFPPLQRTATGTDGAFQLAVDGLAARCTSLGVDYS